MSENISGTDIHLESLLGALLHVILKDGCGKKGVGLYRMPRLTWSAFTRRPPEDAKRDLIAHEVATIRLECICAALAYVGMKPDARRLALCWRFGIEVAAHFRVPTKAQERWAFRVTQQYRARFLKKHLAETV